MYWPGTAATWSEAHNAFGTTETGVKWGLAEGRRGGPRAFESYILIANPSEQDAPVKVTFLKPDGTTSVVVRDGQPFVLVPAHSRENVGPAEMPLGEFGATRRVDQRRADRRRARDVLELVHGADLGGRHQRDRDQAAVEAALCGVGSESGTWCSSDPMARFACSRHGVRFEQKLPLSDLDPKGGTRPTSCRL